MENRQKQMRAAVFCRCSTEDESQKDALLQQQREAKACVIQQGWQLTGLYVEAKSGTTTKGRREYNRLFSDLERDIFDIVVIKSQDRLMRNVKDWYLFLEQLQKNGKQLYMYLEQKFYAPEDALLTGIKAILAEEYSRELSKKINLAHRHRQQEGRILSITNATYGYRKLADKSVVVEEKERPLIEHIFHDAANGYGSTVIAKRLYEKGYRNRKGEMLSPAVIRGIVKNPLYMGTAVQNRRHRDFERKQTLRNPKEAWIYHEQALPAIVTREEFDKANAYLQARSQKYSRKREKEEHSSCKNRMCKDQLYETLDFSFGQKLVCGLCGKPYCRIKRTKRWVCRTYQQQGRIGCDNSSIKEDTLVKIVKVINQGMQETASFQAKLMEVKQIMIYPEKILLQMVGASQSLVVAHESCSTRERIEREKAELLNWLQEEPHLSMRELAEKRGTSYATIRRRIEELEQEGKLSFYKKERRWVVSRECAVAIKNESQVNT